MLQSAPIMVDIMSQCIDNGHLIYRYLSTMRAVHVDEGVDDSVQKAY